MWWWLFAVAWSVAGVSSAIAIRNYWFPKSPAALHVALQDMDGQLAVQWNSAVQAIQEAEGGVLEIQEWGSEAGSEDERAGDSRRKRRG